MKPFEEENSEFQKKIASSRTPGVPMLHVNELHVNDNGIDPIY